MYSKQGALLQQFYEALEPRAADAMFALLGQCQHDLEHRGRLSILNTLPAGASGAVATVANYPIPPDSYATQYPSNGLAMEFFGKVKFNGVVEFAQEQIGAGAANIPAGAMWMWAGDIGDIPAGWAIMDGTANSVGNGGSGIDMRGYLPMQYTGSGDFANIGDAVAIDIGWSGDPIAGDSSTPAVTVAKAVSGVTVETPILSHEASGNATTLTDIWTVDDSPSLAVFDGTTAPDSNYLSGDGQEVTSFGHDHDIDTADIAGLFTDHPATACSVTEPDSGTGHSHSATVTIDNTFAGALSINTPNALRPPGKVVAYIEKLAA